MKDIMNKIIAVNKELVNWKVIEQEVIFLHNKEKVFYELNKTATYIWLNANGKRLVRGIIEGLASKFLVNKEKAENDALEFITEAIKNKIFIFA